MWQRSLAPEEFYRRSFRVVWTLFRSYWSSLEVSFKIPSKSGFLGECAGSTGSYCSYHETISAFLIINSLYERVYHETRRRFQHLYITLWFLLVVLFGTPPGRSFGCDAIASHWSCDLGMRLNNHTTVNVHFIFISVELSSVRSLILATTVFTIEALKLNQLISGRLQRATTGLLSITLRDYFSFDYF